MEGGTSLGPEIDRDKIGQILTLDISGALDDPNNKQVVRRMDIQSLGKTLLVDEIQTELFNSLDTLNDPTNRVYSYADFGKLTGIDSNQSSATQGAVGVADLLVFLGKFGQTVQDLVNNNDFFNGAEQFILPGGSSFVSGRTTGSASQTGSKATGSLNDALVQSGILTQNGPNLVTGKFVIDQLLNQNPSSSDDPAELEIRGCTAVPTLGSPTIYFTDLGAGAIYDTGTLAFESASGFNFDRKVFLDSGSQFEEEAIFNIKPRFSDGMLVSGDPISAIGVNLLINHITASGGVSIDGDITASNLSGTNTGDQDLSAYATTGSNIFIGTETISTPNNGSTVTSLVISGSGRRTDAELVPQIIYSNAGQSMPQQAYVNEFHTFAESGSIGIYEGSGFKTISTTSTFLQVINQFNIGLDTVTIEYSAKDKSGSSNYVEIGTFTYVVDKIAPDITFLQEPKILIGKGLNSSPLILSASLGVGAVTLSAQNGVLGQPIEFIYKFKGFKHS